MPRFKKRPVIIEAQQFIGDNARTHAVYLWVEKNSAGSLDYNELPAAVLDWPKGQCGVTINPEDGSMHIVTLEGLMKVDLGDWVIQGVEGEFYPCKPDIFEKTYEPIASLAASNG